MGSQGAFGWQLSNPSVLCLASLRASLDVFDKTNMVALRRKSILLTRYLERLIMSSSSLKDCVRVISPKKLQYRGSQLSLVFNMPMMKIHDFITTQGIVCDLRKPSVMRIA